MNDKYLSYLIIFLLSIVGGMVIGLVMRKNISYHGPNAKSESKKMYVNKKNGTCIHFAIKPIDCPKTFWQKFFGM